MRYLYSIQKFLQNREQLKSYLSNPDRHVDRVIDLEPEFLKNQGVEVLILDFDGVLASHGEIQPRPDVESWLHRAIVSFPVGHLFILSNKPLPIRIQYFTDHFPSIHFVNAARKKPYPDGIDEILKITDSNPKQALLVDDRLATGMLAVEITGIRGCLVLKPYTQFNKRPFKEAFFCCLRWLEQLI